MVLLFCVIIFFTEKDSLSIIFIASSISFALSYFFFFLATLILSPLAIVFLSLIKDKQLCYLITTPLLGIVQILIANITFRIKRLKNGMPFLLKKGSNGTGVFVSVVILVSSSALGMSDENYYLFSVIIFLTAMCGLFLFLWWKRQLTKTYLDKLRANELRELQTEIEKLKNDNERLSRIIHKDNKLIPAMYAAVRELLFSHTPSEQTESEKIKLSKMLEELDKLSNERTNILNISENQAVTLPSTNMVRFDSLIRYLYYKAASYDIHFNILINANVTFMVQNIIAEADLDTIIADLVENAIIASKTQPVKNILLSIDIENGDYCINIFDSGICFDTDTILNIGKIRYTTHAATGGSGIGLMSTFEILSTYSASFVIDETINNTLYTKKVCICFDRLNQFRIKSTRKDFIDGIAKRDDIRLL